MHEQVVVPGGCQLQVDNPTPSVRAIQNKMANKLTRVGVVIKCDNLHTAVRQTKNQKTVNKLVKLGSLRALLLSYTRPKSCSGICTRDLVLPMQ